MTIFSTEISQITIAFIELVMFMDRVLLLSLQQEYAKEMEEKAKKIAEEKERRELEAKQLMEQLEQAKAAKEVQMKKLSALSTPDAVHIQDTHGETDDVSSNPFQQKNTLFYCISSTLFVCRRQSKAQRSFPWKVLRTSALRWIAFTLPKRTSKWLTCSRSVG